MKRTTSIAILVGCAVAAAVVIVARFGVLDLWEQQSIDFRFLHVKRPPKPMTDQIVHVDIDDASLDHVGRWPWDRSILADAVTELARGGAQTIAVDLVLTDEQGAEQDQAFAEALSQARSIVSVVIHDGPVFDSIWTEADGRTDLERLLTVLGGDVQLEPEEALAAAGVGGFERRLRFKRRPLMFKQAAAWRVLRTHAADIKSFRAFERFVTPNRSEYVASYPEQRILEQVWTQHRAWEAAREHLVPGEARGAYNDRAALPEFVEASGGVGFVNVTDQQRADVAVREAEVLLPAPGGRALQFGLAAAAEHLNLRPSDLSITADRLLLGSVRLPLHDERLWIFWPTSTTEPRWEGLLQQDQEDDPETAGHIPMRQLVEMPRARRKHEANRAKFADLTGRVLEAANYGYVPGEELEPRNLGEAESEVEFVLSDMPDSGSLEAIAKTDPMYAAHMENCRKWVTAREVFAEGERKLEKGSEELRSRVQGKLVFIGWTATGALADFVPTSIGPRTPGVIVHAAIANMALTGSAVRFLPAWMEPVIALGLGLLCTIAAARFSMIPSLVLLAAVIGGYVLIAGTWVFAAAYLIMPFVEPIAAGVASWTACTAYQAAASQQERTRITRQFKARVSTQLVDHLVSNPAAVTMTGEERELTVLFGDLAGFTSISEHLGGPTTVSTLNRYMGALTDVLIAQGAYLNKFLGDGLMAFWSAFALDPDQAVKACHGALNCQNAVEQLNHDPRYADIPKLGLRIGIATGRVVVGDCGAPPALNDYTVIGDAVNLSARLESANKQFGTRILINGRTRELLNDAPILVRLVGRIVVVGQSEPVAVYEVLAPETSEAYVASSEAAIGELAAGRVGDGLAALAEFDRQYGQSRLSALYREVIAEADGAFDGILRLREK